MRTASFLLVVVMLGCCVSAVPAQATYDLANYFMLTHNAWRIDAEHQAGTTIVVGKTGILVQAQGGYLEQYHVERKGPNTWVLDDISRYKLTSTHLEYHGTYDPINSTYELLNPPLRVPRKMQLGVPFTQRTLVTDEKSNSTWMTFTLVFTADKLTKKTTAGTFTGCVRFKSIGITNTETWTDSEIRTPLVGTISEISVEVEETEPEPTMVYRQFVDCEQYGIFPAKIPDLR